MTSSSKAAGRFGKQDFVYVAAEDVYRCPAGERLTYSLHDQGERVLRRYRTSACQSCAIKAQLHHRQRTTDLPMGARSRS